MQHTVQHAVGLESKDILDQQVSALFPADAVAVPHQTALAIDDKGLLPVKHLTSKGLGEIVLHPHIVVAGKIINFNTLLVKLIKGIEKTEVSLGHHIAVLEPEVEDVAQQKEMADMVLFLVQQGDQQLFPRPAPLLGRRPEMGVCDEEGVTCDGDGVLEEIVVHR